MTKISKEEYHQVHYMKYHIKSKSHFARNLSVENNWNSVHVERKTLDKETIKILKDVIDKCEGKELSHSNKVELLKVIITLELDNRISAYFLSEYTPIWMRLFKYDPKLDKLPPAVGWHCDSGPTQHLKLLLYLSDTDECGGGTAFLDKFSTQRLKNIGYGFCSLEQRVEDLSTTFEAYKIEHQIYQPRIQAGDVILFEPNNIMHRAVWPTDDYRYLIQVCLVPSIEFWYNIVSNSMYPRESNAWPILDTLTSDKNE